MKKLKGITRGNITLLISYLVLGLTCIVIATEVDMSYVWHDALLVIGGILLGGFCAIFAWIKYNLGKEVNK